MNKPAEGRAFGVLREFREVSQVSKISKRLRSAVRCLARSVALMAAVLVLSAASHRAEALSLVNPGALTAAKAASGASTIDVAGHGGGGGHGGGAFHGGGGGAFHGGGAAFHGAAIRGGAPAIHGGFRAAPAFHGGAFRTAHVFRGGVRHGGLGFRHHRFHRGFFVGSSYYYDDYPYYYYPGRCRVIWTDYGRRRVCHFRHWRHRHWHHRHW
jgi:hypothetical protein